MTKRMLIIQWYRKDEDDNMWIPAYDEYWDEIGKIRMCASYAAARDVLKEYEERHPKDKFRISELVRTAFQKEM